MSTRFFGMLVACVFALATTTANADTPCGCGQVVAPCGDCYGSSVVNPYSAGGMVYDGMSGGISYGGGVAVDGGAGIVSGGIVDGGAIVGGGEVFGGAGVAGGVVGGGGCCGQSVRYETRTIYQSQMTTQMRTVTRTRMRTETRTQNYTVNVQVPVQQTQNYTVMVSEPRTRTESYTVSVPYTCLLYTSPSPRDKRQSRMPSSA